MITRASAEALVAGTLYPLAHWTVTEADIISFAREWDPQAFHIDPGSAAASRFGGVIASGIHTLAIFMKLGSVVYDTWDIVAGRRLRDVEYVKPVRAGTVLTGAVEILEVEHYSTTRSLLTHRGTLRGTDSDLYMTLILEAVVMRAAVPRISKEDVNG